MVYNIAEIKYTSCYQVVMQSCTKKAYWTMGNRHHWHTRRADVLSALLVCLPVVAVSPCPKCQNVCQMHIFSGIIFNLVIKFMATVSSSFPLNEVQWLWLWLWLWLRRQHLLQVAHVIDCWPVSSGCNSGPGAKLPITLAEVRPIIGHSRHNFPFQAKFCVDI
jgi:hypothetical protein